MGKREQSEITKGNIIQSASQLFVKKGFYGTSISDLSKEVGLTKGAIYHHFENKEAICSAVIKYVQVQWRINVAKKIEGIKDPREKLEILLENHFLLMGKNPTLCLVIHGLLLEFDENKDYLLKEIQKMYSEFARFIELIIKLGQRDGAFNKNLEAGFYAKTIIGILRGNSCNFIFKDMELKKKIKVIKEMILNSLE